MLPLHYPVNLRGILCQPPRAWQGRAGSRESRGAAVNLGTPTDAGSVRNPARMTGAAIIDAALAALACRPAPAAVDCLHCRFGARFAARDWQVAEAVAVMSANELDEAWRLAEVRRFLEKGLARLD